MSDFGAIITIKKKTGSFDENDKTKISAELTSIIKPGNYSDIIKNGDFKTLYGWDENMLCSKLTEYYDGDDADAVREFAGEEDLDEAKQIAGKLQQRMGSGFVITALFEDW